MSWAFRIGMRVVCIDDCWRHRKDAPHKGDILTVFSIEFVEKGEPVLTPDGWIVPAPYGVLMLGFMDFPQAWNSRSFKPLDESRLDQFRVHLHPLTREVEPA